MWDEDDKDGRVWDGGGGETEGASEESSVQRLKKHCSNATGEAAPVAPYSEVCLLEVYWKSYFNQVLGSGSGLYHIDYITIFNGIFCITIELII